MIISSSSRRRFRRRRSSTREFSPVSSGRARELARATGRGPSSCSRRPARSRGRRTRSSRSAGLPASFARPFGSAARSSRFLGDGASDRPSPRGAGDDSRSLVVPFSTDRWFAPGVRGAQKWPCSIPVVVLWSWSVSSLPFLPDVRLFKGLLADSLGCC